MNIPSLFNLFPLVPPVADSGAADGTGTVTGPPPLGRNDGPSDGRIASAADATPTAQDPESTISEAGDGRGVGARRDASTDEARGTASNAIALSDEELALVRQLAAIDREVRAHEQAHAAVGGRYAGSPSYTYTRGPDGRQYAIGGEVPIDLSPIPGNPEATIAKAQVVRRAALAPAQPSSQDRSVAARATAMEQRARVELRELEAAEREAAGGEIEASPRAASTQEGGVGDAGDEARELRASYQPIDIRA
ncbi:MAG: putative metalloprotease CJM1_0395 family protein [Halieaceae bacterium]|nr:putative metalloprotease CJM1_0395 family protein [Halieaceae bacterium]